LTIRFTDAAGNFGDQVFAFNVTAPEPPPNYYEQPAPPAVCQVLGADGLTSGKLKIVSASSSKREFKFGVSAGAGSLIRVDVIESGSAIGSSAFAVKGGASKLKLTLKRAPANGKKLELAVRFYSVKREYGTAHLALSSTHAGVRIAASAQSTLDVVCPTPVGASAKAKFTVLGAAAGARSFDFSSKGKSPALIALKLTRSGAAKPLLSTLVAAPQTPGKIKLKLPGSTRLARGSYTFSFDALSAGGQTSSGRGAFTVR
jgi:methionine-rich copper-binding protein CopC